MKDLIAKLEQAAEGSRELSAEIAKTINWGVPQAIVDESLLPYDVLLKTFRPCSLHRRVESEASMSELTERLRDLAACKHDDLSVGFEAADRIEKLEAQLQELVSAFEWGGVEMNSPEIGGHDPEIPPHPWHEEWLYKARALLGEKR